MPHHYGGSSSKSKSKNTGSHSRSYNPGAGGVVQHSPTKTKTKTTVTKSNDHRTTVNAQKHFINTKLPPMKTTTGSMALVANILDSFTGASVKNRAFFDKNYKRIRSNKTYLPTKIEFDALPLADKQKLYRKTRLDIMRSNQNPFGETEPGGNGGPPVKKVVGGQTILAAAPTEAEVSQSDATNAAETKLTKRRVKARGRKMNIYTSSSGKTTDKLILGKKSLLGMV